ncbi:CDP-glycerol glycerophosphotransferase family protein [Erwinia oleae]|uniref:CDP-glycerol glycerophosphotransferase family protein n=1 Tax=Erwinia oleae TaxID=796334 RepID=UPI00068BD310|nr:CDP-glycerol glycerophosphotransferase family protein [Erwinia oleae]
MNNALATTKENFEKISLRMSKRPRVLFFDRESFADNCKYLYLYMVRHCPEIEVIWCSYTPKVIAELTAAGLPCLDMNANVEETIKTFLQAAVAIFCVNPSQSLGRNEFLQASLKGAAQIQLWHGVSVKQLMLRLVPFISMSDPDAWTLIRWATQPDYFLSTASVFDSFWRDCFACRQLIRAAYPRNEVLIRPAQGHELINASLAATAEKALSGQKKTLLLAPTWQRNKGTALYETRFLIPLLKYAAKNNIEVFLKSHAYSTNINDFSGMKVPHFHVIADNLDIYPHLRRFDLLVTDYSSIAFDFLLTGKPVLMQDIPPGSHELFEPDYSLLPGDGSWRHLFTHDTIHEVIENALYHDDKQAARANIVRQLFETETTDASRRLASVTKSIMESRCGRRDEWQVI